MRIHIRINGEAFEPEVKPLDRLLDVIRAYRGLTGTKEGCGEGECGACAVILDGRLVNSCMVPAMELHGSRVLTIEGLGGESDSLQRAFVEEGAVQCGFCTPGMVLASRALLAENPHPTREEIKEGLSGNLCRCTGYEKIIKAVSEAAEKGYGETASRDLEDQIIHKPSHPAVLSDSEKNRVFLPCGLNEACRILDRFHPVYLVAGGTDLYPNLRKGMEIPCRLMDLTHIDELKSIEENDGAVRIGSGVTTRRLEKDPLVARHFPALRDAARLSAAPAVKNRATLGGNLMSASPAADLPPVLLMLGAKAIFKSVSGSREVPMTDFFKGYRKTDIRPGELLESVIVPIPRDGTRQAFFKRGSRKSLTIARVNMACSARLENGLIRDLKIVAGTMSVLPAFLTEVSALAEGRRPDEALAEEIRKAAWDAVHPRTSGEYRKNVTGNMAARFVFELNYGN